jgi:2-aminobenzoate-CoA ligase
MIRSAHVDPFARDRLPPPAQWPELRFDRPELQFPERINAAAHLIDTRLAAGDGARPAVRGDHLGAPVDWSYAELARRVDALAHVLVSDLGLVPGQRVLLRGANSPMLAALWLAVVKAGGIAVGTMPLLRAAELVPVIQKAEISYALCDARLRDELDMARAQCPTLTTVALFHDTGPDAMEARAARHTTPFAAVDTAADDVALIAFTSGTTGPRARCTSTATCWPPAPAGRRMCFAPPPTTCSSAARRWRSPSGWAGCCCFR